MPSTGKPGIQGRSCQSPRRQNHELIRTGFLPVDTGTGRSVENRSPVTDQVKYDVVSDYARLMQVVK